MPASKQTDERSPSSSGNGAESARCCPRCGGTVARRERRVANPFLCKAPAGLTCVDCGLEVDPHRDSGGDPWVKGE